MIRVGIAGIGVAVVGITVVTVAVFGVAAITAGAAGCNSGGYGDQKGLAGLDGGHVALAIEGLHQLQIVFVVNLVAAAEGVGARRSATSSAMQ